MTSLNAARSIARPVLGSLLKLHRRLLPARPEIGWTPYLWLFYLSFVFWRWFFEVPSGKELVVSLVAIAAFLVFYFNGYWHLGLRVGLNMAGIVLIAWVLTPINPGALTFFIYAAGFAGFIGTPRRGWQSIGAIVLAALAAAFFYGMPWFWTAMTTVLVVMNGAGKINFAEVGRQNQALLRSQEEVERLASLAERERIARDLHDLLGHTLTTITVKAELARRLSERGDARARDEIADVERISREALAQVREAVAGFADIGLVGELKRARLVCEARGIELVGDARRAGDFMDTGLLDVRRETALAMVLREAITNVIRHSRASTCRVWLDKKSAEILLVIEDDGRGGSGSYGAGSGHGLAGMRERLDPLGGRLLIETPTGPEGGFRVTASVAVDPEVMEPASSEAPGVSALPEPA